MIVLDFERKIFELESKIKELQLLSSPDINVSEEVKTLQKKLQKTIQDVYSKLTPWEKVQIARHPERPQSIDYIDALITNFIPLAGDRKFGEDSSIIAGIGQFNGESVAIIGHNKGKETEERIKNNFGMPMPEGYRKAERIMSLADSFSLPIITFIDTSGAFPGIQAEERGQAEAIASCIEKSFNLSVPMISIIIGEGGSGGAIAIGVANIVLMLEYAVYSVISPEGCASILWKSSDEAVAAAEVLKLTAQDLLKMSVIDGIIKEPIGAAHRNKSEIIKSVGNELSKQLIKAKTITNPREHREEKFLSMGR